MKDDPMGEMREFVLRAEGQTNGQAWMDLLLQNHARVLFELQWMVFMLGQVGSFYEIVKMAPERVDEMNELFDQIEESCDDLTEAAAAVSSVARDIVANGRRNMERLNR